MVFLILLQLPTEPGSGSAYALEKFVPESGAA
jgi:hypothetical protein